MKTVWILGDQLSHPHTALAGADPAESVVLMIESKARGGALRYHQLKLVLVTARCAISRRNCEGAAGGSITT